MPQGFNNDSDFSLWGFRDMQHEYFFFGGRRVARKDLPAKTVFYYFSDHLRSASVITDSAGNIKAGSDYRPFGAELQFVNNDSNDYKFSSKKRDAESGLDYFGARYYSNAYGRFVTADWSAGPATVPYAHLDNPQSLNLYSYVDNNPINGIDPDGHSAQEYMIAPVQGSFGDLISDGTGETTDSGEDGAAIDAWNAYATAYNDAAEAYNQQLRANDAYQQSLAAQGPGANGFFQAGIDNARNALTGFSTAKLSDFCSSWLNDLGAQAGRPFTATSLQAEAAAAANFIYDGPSSPTPQSALGEGSGLPIGLRFQFKPDLLALSQPNGHAIWIRSSELAKMVRQDGRPSRQANGLMIHELMHKFRFDDAQIAKAFHNEAAFNKMGSYVHVLRTQAACGDY